MTDCRACAYCGIEPDDMNFHCSHPTTGSVFGRYIDTMRATGAACGPDATLFVQHPLRNADGSLWKRAAEAAGASEARPPLEAPPPSERFALMTTGDQTAPVGDVRSAAVREEHEITAGLILSEIGTLKGCRCAVQAIPCGTCRHALRVLDDWLLKLDATEPPSNPEAVRQPRAERANMVVRLRDSLRDVLSLIAAEDSGDGTGELVRDVSRDDAPDYALRMMRLVTILATATALADEASAASSETPA